MFGSIGRAALRAGLATGVLAIPLAFLPVDAALADTPPCNVTFTGTVAGSVVVPSGTNSCIHDAHVTGSVTIRLGGSADVQNSTIDGAVSSTGATGGEEFRALLICNSTLGSLSVIDSRGNVLVGDGNDQECPANTIKGSVAFSNNHAEVGAAGNAVGGSIAVTGNDGEEVDLAANHAGGSIVCSGNSAPFDFPHEGPNTAGGAITGQCANLPATAVPNGEQD